jgi:hypothetical protein
VEVGYSIAKYLTKLKTLYAGTDAIINTGYIGLTEEMAVMIARRILHLKDFIL